MFEQMRTQFCHRLVILLCPFFTGVLLAQPATTQPNSAWAFHGGGALLGRAPNLPAPPMKIRWTYHTDEEGNGGVEAAAAIANGCVYVGDGKGVLHAIDLATGQRKWVYQAPDGFATTPLINGNRILIGDLSGVFHAVSDKGEKLWTIETGATIHASANAERPDADRMIISNDAGKIFCINPTTGEQIWNAQAGDRVNGAGAIANGVAYFAGCDEKFLALNMSDGKPRFAVEMGAVSGGSPLIIDKQAVIGTDGGRVICFSSEDGSGLWAYDQIEGKAMAYASPAIADGIVVIGARDRKVHAVDLSNGKQLWTFAARLDVDSSPLISAGRVYVGSRDKSLYVLDLKTGKSLWEFKASHSITASPAISEGVLVISDTTGTVYCLEPSR
jgi:outer membrane protein assembly factor BamB